MKMTQTSAEVLGLKALSWLAGNEELCPIFLGASGASQDDLRENAADPVFLGHVLDFVMMDDAWVVQFCDSNACAYTDPMMARQMLPGGGAMHWT